MPGFSGFFFDKLIKGSLLVSVVLALTTLAPVDWTTESAGAPQITLGPDDPAILVVFRPSSTSAQIADVYRQHDLKLVKRLPVLGRAERVYVPPERHAAVLAALRSEPAVELAENDSSVSFPQPVRTLRGTLFVPHPSWGVAPRMAPNDQFFRNQWAPEKINLMGAWDITTGRPEIKVAVLDSGFYADHPDRPTNLVLGPDATSSGGSGVDPVGHGTHVAGTIGAKLNNSIGIAGVAPNVTVGIVRAGGESGIRDSDAAAGIRWAVDNGFRVINLSFGGPRPSELQRQQIDYAYSKNVIIAAAAGNCGNGCTEGAPNYVHYPSSFDHVISVAASTDNDGIADFSQRNRSVAVAAPGQQIASTMSPNGSNANPNSCDSRLLYCYLSGTSMASPHLAGIVGLMLSVNAALTPDQVVDILKATAVNLGQPSQAQGAGRVDALAAIRAAQGATGRPSPTATTPSASTPAPTPGGAPSGSAAAFVPLVRQDYDDAILGGRWTSGVQVANLDTSQTARITLRLVDASGRVASERTADLQPTKSTTFFGSTLGAPASFSGSAVVYADRTIAVITNQLLSSPGAADSFNGVSAPATTVHVPQVRRSFTASGASSPTNTSLYVQNAGSVATSQVRVSFFATAETPVATATLPAIPPGASAELALKNVAGLPDSYSGTAVVTADQPVAVAVNLADGRAVASYSNASPGSPLYAPLVMLRNGDFTSEVYVQNAGTAPTVVSATGIDSRTGQKVTWDPLTLLPGTGRTLGVPGDGSFLGAATITSSGAPLVGFALQSNTQIGQASGYTLFTRSGARVIAPLVQTSNSGWQTGFQVQNVGSSSASVTVRVTDAAGNEVQSVPNPTRTLVAGGSETWFPISAVGTRIVGAAEAVGSSGSQLIGVVNQLNQDVSGDQLTTYSAAPVDDRVSVPTPIPQPTGTPFSPPPGPTATPRPATDFGISGCSNARSLPSAGARIGFAAVFRRANGTPVPNARLYVALNYAEEGIGIHQGPVTDRNGFAGGYLTLEGPLAENAFAIIFDYQGAGYYRIFTFGGSGAYCPTLTPASTDLESAVLEWPPSGQSRSLWEGVGGVWRRPLDP